MVTGRQNENTYLVESGISIIIIFLPNEALIVSVESGGTNFNIKRKSLPKFKSLATSPHAPAYQHPIREVCLHDHSWFISAFHTKALLPFLLLLVLEGGLDELWPRMARSDFTPGGVWRENIKGQGFYPLNKARKSLGKCAVMQYHLSSPVHI